MSAFDKDFNWQEKYYPLIKKVLLSNSMYIMRVDVADAYKDMKQATDFIVNIKGGTVAVRIRRKVGVQYKDITIRSKRPSGVETELSKIIKGFANYYLYLWTFEEEIVDWWLIDMDKVRTSKILEKPRHEIWNKDRSSAFIAIQAQELKNIEALINQMQTK